MISEFAKYLTSYKDAEFVIFDIGSRDCQQSIEFYHAFPKARIFAIECNKNTIPLCRKNIVGYTDRITLLEVAVNSFDGECDFFPIDQEKTITSWKDGNPGASSLFVSNGTYPVETYIQNHVKTPCKRLDTLLREYGISRIDVIWMDLQGAELLALRSLGKHLHDIQYLYMEVSHKEMYTGQVMFSELHGFMVENGFEVQNALSLSGWQEDAVYKNRRPVEPLFDIVIPVGPKDVALVNTQVEFTKRNVLGYRNIYLVTCDPTVSVEGCITLYESLFPFSKATVAEIHGPHDRNGWYFQQLLKLYAGLVIPGILDRYLVIDCDTFFMRPTTFVYEGKSLYTSLTEYHPPYFEHMARLSPLLTRVDPEKSGICHHMLFETHFVKELMDLVEAGGNGVPFYRRFLETVQEKEIPHSGSSEYELYFNYVCTVHPEAIYLRPLTYQGITHPPTEKEKEFDYVSCHWWTRPEEAAYVPRT